MARGRRTGKRIRIPSIARKNTVYVFFGSQPKRVVVELDYTITNMAQVYDDVSEVYGSI